MLKPKEKNIFGKMEFVFGISSLRKLKIVKISKLLNLDASNTYLVLDKLVQEEEAQIYTK